MSKLISNMSDLKEKFVTEIFDPTKHSWGNIKERIIFIEHEAFGDKAFSDEQFENDFKNKNSTVVLLKNSNSNVVGFIYAQSVDTVFSERTGENKEIAIIWDIVIEEKFRGKHLAGILTDRLEEELKKRKYKYIEMDARIENSYADNVAKHYKDRIVKQSEPHNSPWGEQIFFRIKL